MAIGRVVRSFRWVTAVAVVFAATLLVLSGALRAAEIRERPELASRLAGLVPVYGDFNADFRHGPVLLEADPTGYQFADRTRIITVDGVITEGDAARLVALIGPYEDAGRFVVILSSPGGSFLEGVRMGEALQPYRGGQDTPPLNGVLVLEGSECLSACAVAFALAALPRDSGVSARFVEIGARLGFHMPFVPVNQQNQRTEISRAMDLTYEVMSEYIRLISNGIAPTALVQNALHYRRPEDFFELRGGMITRFMDFVPVAGPIGGTPITLSGLTQRDALNMCQYLAYSRARNFVSAEYEFWPVEVFSGYPDDIPLMDLFRSEGSARLANAHCGLEWLPGDRLGLQAREICKSDTPAANGWCRFTEDDTFGRSLPPARGALLAASLGCHNGVKTNHYYRWDWNNVFLEEETPEDYRWQGSDPEIPRHRLDWQGATLEANVNLRASPGGPKLTQLAAGTPVDVLDCALSADAQGVWYQLQAGGLTGWASARYVRVPSLAGWDFMVRPAVR